MSYETSVSLSFDEAVKISEGILSRKNPKFKTLSALFIPSETRRYLFFGYFYLRWIDDFVDSNKHSLEEKKKFFNDQVLLAKALTDGKSYKLNYPEEYFLYYLVDFILKEKKEVLIEALFSMLETIKYDIERLGKDGIFTENQMKEYLDIQTRALFRAVNAFLLPDREQVYADRYESVYTLCYVLLLRDILNDLNSGYINISREEMVMFNIDTKDLVTDTGFKRWFAYKTSFLNERLLKDTGFLSTVDLKLKLYWCWAFPYSYRRIIRTKIYNYDLIKMTNRKPLSELKIYVLTFINGLKFLSRIFF